jgi:hypothetical protein
MVPPDRPDRSEILTGLMENPKIKRVSTKHRLANDDTTDRFLEAGIRLLAQAMGLGEESTEFFKKWISINEVVREANRDGPLPDGELPNKEAHVWRWPVHDDYIRDLISHILTSDHWGWQTSIIDESTAELTYEGDLVKAIQIVCYSDLRTLIQDPMQRILPLVTILISKDAASRGRRSEHYRQVRDKWVELFEATFTLYNIRLRPGIDIQEAADILTALSDGLAMRATGDPDAKVINTRAYGDSLLGRAATMMLLAGIDPGDKLSLEDALRRAIPTQAEE